QIRIARAPRRQQSVESTLPKEGAREADYERELETCRRDKQTKREGIVRKNKAPLPLCWHFPPGGDEASDGECQRSVICDCRVKLALHGKRPFAPILAKTASRQRHHGRGQAGDHARAAFESKEVASGFAAARANARPAAVIL